MNESAFNVLTRGGEKEWERLLDSLGGIKGAKEVNRPSEDVVTFRVERRVTFYIRISPVTASAVERLVTEYKRDWSISRANAGANRLVERVFNHLGSGKSDRLPQYVIVEIHPTRPVLYLSSEPEPQYLNLESGKAVVLERYWGQKAKSPGTGISTIAILDKRVSVKDLRDLIDRLIRSRDKPIRGRGSAYVTLQGRT
jgi:hypothetical protein